MLLVHSETQTETDLLWTRDHISAEQGRAEFSIDAGCRRRYGTLFFITLERCRQLLCELAERLQVQN